MFLFPLLAHCYQQVFYWIDRAASIRSRHVHVHTCTWMALFISCVSLVLACTEPMFVCHMLYILSAIERHTMAYEYLLFGCIVEKRYIHARRRCSCCTQHEDTAAPLIHRWAQCGTYRCHVSICMGCRVLCVVWCWVCVLLCTGCVCDGCCRVPYAVCVLRVWHSHTHTHTHTHSAHMCTAAYTLMSDDDVRAASGSTST